MAVTSSAGFMVVVILDEGTPRVRSVAALVDTSAGDVLSLSVHASTMPTTGKLGTAYALTGGREGRSAQGLWRSHVEDNCHHHTSARRDRHPAPRR